MLGGDGEERKEKGWQPVGNLSEGIDERREEIDGLTT